MRPSGNTPKHPPSGEVHGRRGRETGSTADVGRTLESRTPRGHRPQRGFGLLRCGLSEGSKALKPRVHRSGLAACAMDAKGKRATTSKGVRLLGEDQDPEGESP